MVITSVQQFLEPVAFNKITASLMGRNAKILISQDPYE